MAFMDLIQELRTGRPNRRRAARVLQGLGIFAVVVLLLNIVSFIIPGALLGGGPVVSVALTLVGLAGVMLIFAGRALVRGARWAIPVAQWAVSLAVVFFVVGSFFSMRSSMEEQNAQFYNMEGGPSGRQVFFEVFILLAYLQFVVPVWFGVRYLGRLRDAAASGDEALETAEGVGRWTKRKG